MIFGLSAALFGEITIRDGRVKQSNFNDYRVLRINEAPIVEVHLIKSSEAPGGIGEVGRRGRHGTLSLQNRGHCERYSDGEHGDLQSGFVRTGLQELGRLMKLCQVITVINRQINDLRVF